MKLSPVQTAYGLALFAAVMVSAGLVIAGVAEKDDYSAMAKKAVIEMANLLARSGLGALITTTFFTAAGVNLIIEPISGLWGCCKAENEDERQRLLSGDYDRITATESVI